MERWIVGMVLALVGCFSSAIGLVLMKHSAMTEADLPFFRRRFSIMGFIFLIINAALIDVIAFALAPLSLLAPFSGVTIVITSWLASSGVLFVHESIDLYDVVSTAVTLVGVLLASSYGPHVEEGPRSPDELYGYFNRHDFHVCMSTLVFVLALGWGFESLAQRRDASREVPSHMQPPLLPTSTPKSKLGTPHAIGPPETTRAFRVLLLAYTAALSGAMSMLLLKVIGTGILAALEKDMPLLEPGWLLSLVALALCALVQLGFLYRTLANSPVSFAVPTYQALLTVLTVITGGIFFQEFDVLAPFEQLVFAAGVGVTLVGVALHSTHRSTATVEQQRSSLLASTTQEPRDSYVAYQTVADGGFAKPPSVPPPGGASRVRAPDEHSPLFSR